MIPFVYDSIVLRCIHIHVHVHMYIYMYTYTEHTHIHIHVYTKTHVHVHTHIYMHKVHVHVHTQTHVHVHIHRHTYLNNIIIQCTCTDLWPQVTYISYMYRDTFLQSNLDQKLTFNHSSFHHIVQEVNEIWYPGRAIINLLRYQMSLTSCTEWWMPSNWR